MTTPPDEPTVIAEPLEAGITLVRFNRPERLNPINYRFLDEMATLLDHIILDTDCRVVIITGSGRAFSAGGDMDAFDILDPAQSDIPAMSRLFGRAGDVISRIQGMPQPVIAAVNGPAIGGGLSLALAADTRICSESARFSAAFIKLGLSGCEMGTSWLLPRIVGPTRAMDLALSGREFSAREAAAMGMVLDVVADDDLLPRAVDTARTYLANSPIGVRMTKQLMWQGQTTPTLAQALDTEARTQVLCAHSKDHREAYQAFVERRPPRFTGT